jgi:hypothetical protein
MSSRRDLRGIITVPAAAPTGRWSSLMHADMPEHRVMTVEEPVAAVALERLVLGICGRDGISMSHMSIRARLTASLMSLLGVSSVQISRA